MRKLALIAVFGAIALPMSWAAELPGGWHSLGVELPAGDRGFPAAAGSESADRNCLACHSVEMVLNEPALSRAAWEAEVKKMRNVYKAPIDPKDDKALADYLFAIKGQN